MKEANNEKHLRVNPVDGLLHSRARTEEYSLSTQENFERVVSGEKILRLARELASELDGVPEGKLINFVAISRYRKEALASRIAMLSAIAAGKEILVAADGRVRRTFRYRVPSSNRIASYSGLSDPTSLSPKKAPLVES